MAHSIFVTSRQTISIHRLRPTHSDEDRETQRQRDKHKKTTKPANTDTDTDKNPDTDTDTDWRHTTMVIYDAYGHVLLNPKDTFRKYIGYAGDVSKREGKLKRGGPTGRNVSAKCLRSVFFIPMLAANMWRCHLRPGRQ